MTEYYWALTQWDGTVTQIPPSAVDQVQRRWDQGMPIHTSNGSISSKDIKSFAPSESFTNQRLIEGAAKAFNAPIITDLGVKARWIKKTIPEKIYHKYYAGIPAYHRLDSNSSEITIAFRLPIHAINSQNTQECTQKEIDMLTKS